MALSSKNLSVFLLAGFIAVLLDPVAAGMKCKGMDMKEYEQDKMWMMECMKEVEAKTPKEAMMMPCFRKCMVIKRGFIDDMGNANNDKAVEFVKNMAPDALAEEMSMKATKCVEMHAAKVKEWKMSCESYVPTCQCMADVFMETCKM